MKKKIELHHLAAIIGIMFLFGSAYPVGKLGVNHFPPYLFAALRSSVLALILIPFLKFELPPRHLMWPLVGFCACMGVGTYAPIFAALAISESVAPIIIGSQLSIPFAVILGWMVLREKVSGAIWAAIAAGFAGIIIIAYEPSLLRDLPALALSVLSAFFYASATVLARRLRELGSYTLNGWMAFTAILPLLAISFALETGQVEALINAGWPAWATVAHGAIMVSFIGHVAMFSLYRHYEVSQVFPFYALTPVFGILLTVLVFPEIPSVQTLIGGALVMAATYAIGRRQTA
jgi:O-acetylserine/cysteine efflux transporter